MHLTYKLFYNIFFILISGSILERLKKNKNIIITKTITIIEEVLKNSD